MAGNELTLAYLQVGFSKEEGEQLDRALKQRTGTLRPNVDSLGSRRRLRRTPREIQGRESQVSESLSAYRPNSRGQQPYCCSRAPNSRPRPYYHSTTNAPCNCGTSHQVPNPREWQSSLSEEPHWDYSLPNGGHAVRTPKITFADPIVTEVRESERWYADTYGPWSTRGMTNDKSTEADDEQEIQMLDAIDSRSAKVVEEREAKSLQSTRSRALSDRKDFKRLGGDAISLVRPTKEVPAEVDDGDEIRGLDAAEPVEAARDERSKIKRVREDSISRRE